MGSLHVKPEVRPKNEAWLLHDGSNESRKEAKMYGAYVHHEIDPVTHKMITVWGKGFWDKNHKWVPMEQWKEESKARFEMQKQKNYEMMRDKYLYYTDLFLDNFEKI